MIRITKTYLFFMRFFLQMLSFVTLLIPCRGKYYSLSLWCVNLWQESSPDVYNNCERKFGPAILVSKRKLSSQYHDHAAGSILLPDDKSHKLNGMRLLN